MKVVIDEAVHLFVKLFGAHAAVRGFNHHFGEQFFQKKPDRFETLNAVVKIEDLSAPSDLFHDGVADQSADDGFNRLAVVRRGCDKRNITNFQQRHMESAGNRCSRHCQSVDVGFKSFQPLFVLYAETVLFINDEQTEIFKNDILLQ